MFFSVDGVDGAGKSTQIQLLVQWLEDLGHDVLTCRDPGTTPLGEKLRTLLLQSTEDTPIGPRAESLIFMAARAQLVTDVIRPALDDGKIVIADRFVLATVVYQGHGFSLSPAELWSVGEFATDHLLPDHTMVLDLDVEQAAGRRGDQADRMESRDRSYFVKLRDGFLEESKRHPDAISIIDASQSIPKVQEQIRKVAEPFFNR